MRSCTQTGASIRCSGYWQSPRWSRSAWAGCGPPGAGSIPPAGTALQQDGRAIGELRNVFVWGNRQLPRPGYLPAEGSPPKTLHYDQWIGPSPYHPYNPGYFSGGPGANCLQWNMFWDFGTGQVGDMGNHTMDLAWNAIDATYPTAVEAKGDPFNPDVTPVKLEAHFEHPANDWRGPIRVSWYQGKVFPTSPKKYIDLDGIGHGAMFKGTKGVLVADFNSRMLIPDAKADLTEYKIRPKEAQLPEIGDFQEQWINACKGKGRPLADFQYSGWLTEANHLGNVAYRAGKKLEWDPVNLRAKNAPEEPVTTSTRTPGCACSKASTSLGIANCRSAAAATTSSPASTRMSSEAAVTIFCIAVTSAAVAFLSSSPITSARTVPVPTYDSRLGEMPFFSIAAK